MTQPVFITGGTGLVGSFVIRKFLSEGKTVRALRRPASPSTVLADLSHLVDWVEGDILDIPFLMDALQGCGAVVHAAALVSARPNQKDELYRTNIEGTINLVNISLLQQIPRFCFVSSVASLGRGLHLTLDETAKWEESPYNTEYAKTKYAAEKEVWRGMAEGLQAVIVNPSLVLGPGDLNRSSTKIFQYVLSGKRFFPAGSINFVDVRDVAEAIFRLTFSDIAEERFVLSAGNVSYRALFEKIAEGLHKKKPDTEISPGWLSVASRAEQLRSFLTGSQPLVSRETALIARKNYVYDSQKIKDTLGFAFHSLEDTLSWTCAEILKQNPLF